MRSNIQKYSTYIILVSIVLSACNTTITENATNVSPVGTYTDIPTQENTITATSVSESPTPTQSIIEIPTSEGSNVSNTPTPTIIEVTPIGGNGAGYIATVEYLRITNLRSCVAAYPDPIIENFNPKTWFNNLSVPDQCTVVHIYAPHNISRMVTEEKVGNNIWAWQSPNGEYVSALCNAGIQYAQIYTGWFPYADENGNVDFGQAPPAENPCQ